jgi:pimeloyl-ACP methyl ester carboxylesterase
LECASVLVPVDYDRPDAGSIGIAINRAAALTPERRGVVLVNPGGPGAPGKGFLAGSASALRGLLPGFDFIGFDPRGVGESAPLTCVANFDLLRLLRDGGVQAMLEELRSTSRACARVNGARFQNLGSNQVVADMDRIRQGLGVEEINFIGVSYGTRLGELYARTFPEHARAVVLDAPVAPVADSTEQALAQFDAFLQVHALFFADCAAGVLSCPPDSEGIFEGIVASQPTDGDRAQFLRNWQLLLSAPPGRVVLAQLLTQVASGQVMAMPDMPVMASVNALADIYGFANLSTTCADNAVPSPTLEEAEALVASFRERAPEFLSQVIPALVCSGWEVEPDPVPALDLTPRVPLLMIAGTADSLTPLHWAEETKALLPSTSLLLSEHYGHGAIINGSACVFDHMRAYLNDLTPVPEGTTCAARPPAPTQP